MSYHKLSICKHAVGSPWKIQEELLEYIDAVATDNPVMAAQELSDLYGVIELEAKKYGLTMDNLKTMSDLTNKVFINGARKEQDLFTNIVKNSLKMGYLEDHIAFAFMPNDFIYLFIKHGCNYSDDIAKMQLIIEVIQGEVHISANNMPIQESVKIALLDSADTELFISDNTIIKIKPFKAMPLINELESDADALVIITEVCKNAGKTYE